MLSKRLLTIANEVDEGAIIADVGSDHALLPIYLVKNKIAKKAYAIDNKIGPINGAVENIKNHNLEDLIEVRLQSGIIDLEEDVDTVVIAGMGFNTIKTIIETELDSAQNLNKLIIQCNNKLVEFRKFLDEYKFEVTSEKFIVEAEKNYNIITCKYNPDLNKMSNFFVSEYLVAKKDALYLEFLETRLDSLKSLKKVNQTFEEEYESIKDTLKK